MKTLGGGKTNSTDYVKMYYKTKRKSKVGMIIEKSPQLEKEECNISDYLSFEKFNSVIQEFEKKLEKNFKNNMNLFNKNIKNLKINERKMNFFDLFSIARTGSVTRATYSYNQIEYIDSLDNDKNKFRSILMHELLHMSSQKDEQFFGFTQRIETTKGEKYIGIGLTEGYTEKLNQEYFSKIAGKNTYHEEIVLATGIERIIGKDKMADFYFDADLLNLIRYLNFYEKDLDEIADLIVGIDRLNTTEYTSAQYDKLRKQISDIYDKKLQLQKKLNLIDENQYQREKFLYIKQFIDLGVNYSENTRIIEYANFYLIEDENNKNIIYKEDELLKFKADENKVDKNIKNIKEEKASLLVDELESNKTDENQTKK